MKRLFIIIGIACGALTAQAQDMAARFVAMPDSLLPLMTKVNREDCIDFLESKMAAKVKNRFGGQTEMTALTADYLRIQLTELNTVEMKLFPLNDSTRVTCVVSTAYGPAADSDIRFYDAQWRSIPTEQFMEYPPDDIFFIPEDTITDEMIRIHRKADMYMVKADLSPEASTITFTFTTPDYMSKEDREALEKLMRKEPVVYEWKGEHF